jgi:hypothetical protein
LVGVFSTGAVIVGRAVTLRVIIPPTWNSEQNKIDKILGNSDTDLCVKFASAKMANKYINTKKPKKNCTRLTHQYGIIKHAGKHI